MGDPKKSSSNVVIHHLTNAATGVARRVVAGAKLTSNGLAELLTAVDPGGFGEYFGDKLRSQSDTLAQQYSAEGQSKILEEYSESFNMSKFPKIVEAAANQFKEYATSFEINASSIESLQKAMDKRLESMDDATKSTFDEAVTRINTQMSTLSEKAKDNLDKTQRMFTKLRDGITEGVDTSPRGVASVFEGLRQRGIEQIDRDKTEALKQLDELFKEAAFLKDLEIILGTSSQHAFDKEKEKIKNDISAQFNKAESTLKKAFEDQPADPKDKDSQPTFGLSSQMKSTVEQTEYDLLNLVRIARDNKYTPSGNLTATIGDNPEIRKIGPDAFKEVTIEEIQDFVKEREKWETSIFNPMAWLDPNQWALFHKSGLKSTGHLVLEMDGDSVKISVPGKLFSFYHRGSEDLLKADLEQMVDQVKAKGKLPPKMVFTIEAESDLLRQHLTEKAYEAARTRGFKDDEIIFNISGGKEPFEGKKIGELASKGAVSSAKVGIIRQKAQAMEEQAKKLDEKFQGFKDFKNSSTNIRNARDKRMARIDNDVSEEKKAEKKGKEDAPPTSTVRPRNYS